MRRPASWARDIRLALALVLALPGLYANTNTVLASKAQPSTTVEVCEFKTINYITHTLPQQCLRTTWSIPTPAGGASLSTNANAVTATTEPTLTPTLTPTSADNSPGNGTQQEQADHGAPTASPKQEQQEEDPDSNDITASSFMSFEEWKEMMLRKSGQDPAENKGRKKEKDAPGTHAESDSLGDDREIALDFDALSEKVSELTGSSSGEPTPHTSGTAKEEQGDVAQAEVKAQTPYRSKDAGKTCKERFSYSSFDAGATILKTNKGAKNAKAILAENKDSYMLLECRNKNKFVIVELSDDILVDTVVLANFEFFSSMIRKFRVSVSDRYPVKLDKWVDLGTFEARNSRDIQPFLVEHPQIYTKYIRIEFLSHYGNEYYCPVSLLRVHGTRMLDTWKESESNQDDEPEQIDAPVEEQQEEEATKASEPEQTPTQEYVPASTMEEHTPRPQPVTEQGLTPWHPIFYHDKLLETCALCSPTTGEPTPVSSDVNKNSSSATAQSSTLTVTHNAPPSTGSSSSTSTPQDSVPVSSRPTNASAPASSLPSLSSPFTSSSSSSTPTTNNTAAGSSAHKPSSARADAADTASSPAPAAAKATNTTTPTPPRNKTTSAKPNSASSASTPSPTVQESFFKTVTKRLQLLESNTSLSLQYIESQSRFLQEVLLTMEKKQVRRVDTFLDSLNKTVLSELRNVRTQYDQIWQSTVIALETQREQSQREIVALSSRLNVLADEVVFQKRMSILQSVLLLSCLVLVIFSRGGGVGGGGGSSSLDLLSPYNNRQRRHAREQSLVSPSPQTPVPGRDGGGDGRNYYATLPSTIASQQRQFLHSRSRIDKALPLTPQSATDFSRDSTPIIRIDEVDVPFFENVDVDVGLDVDLDMDNTNQLRSSSRTSAAAAAATKAIPPTSTEGEEAGDGGGKIAEQHDRLAENEDENNDADAETSPDLDMTERETTLMIKQEEKDEGHHFASQPDFGFPVADHDPAKPLLRRSTLSQLGGGRKPLPALPEDPSQG
ncbi:UNC-like C-terminal-domain-containing protein [Podospora appendiculata]|uniref:UNC-like C-terminal-domain-containing protein n=1 Tax=Podospora appendiculata TaxID=314037 RepID=A0AAE0XG18_9PEZI|nr:UNC-like C-terminal-domain-containing protein [Podospora appendiculata]